MTGIINFRDFGGKPTTSGQLIKRDRLYRSGHLADANPEEIKSLLDLDFSTVADLRYARERLGSRSPWPESYASRVLCHDEQQDLNAPHIRLLKSPTLDEDAIAPFYLDFYRKLPFETPYQKLLATLLHRLSVGDSRALVHCSIGKDRTGVFAAVILRALGADADVAMADYMLSRSAPSLAALVSEIHRILRAQVGRSVSIKVAERLLFVEEDYLAATFQAIDEQFGSLERYLEAIGFERAAHDKLRAQLVA